MAAILAVIGYLTQGIFNIYPLIFTFSLTLFGLVILIGIEYFKRIREKRFFEKAPFNEIKSRTIETTKVQRSKFDFPKTQRIMELNGQKFAVEYYDDFFKFPISDVLLIYNQTNMDIEPIVINYKRKKYSGTELLNEISCV